jgi:CRISPR-associated protein Cas1
MITYPDFIAKKMLVVSSDQLRDLRFANENVVIEEDGKIIQQVSLHTVFSIIVIGDCTITSRLIGELKKHGIILALLRQNFTVVEVLGGEMNGNTLLRELQYRRDGDDLEIAKRIVENKIYSEQLIIDKIREKTDIQKETIGQLAKLRASARDATENDSLLGIEGSAAKAYFSTYFDGMDWLKRSPRTKFDVNNVLLDIGYTFLFHFIEALLLLYGFDVYHGVYHKQFYARKSLVCDIQEPFRCIVDEALRKAYNLGQISEKDFGHANGGYFILPPMVKKYTVIFFNAIIGNKEEMYAYVQLYYRYIMDNTREFPKFVPK